MRFSATLCARACAAFRLPIPLAAVLCAAALWMALPGVPRPAQAQPKEYDGLELCFQDRDQHRAILEYVPQGETCKRWSEKITARVFFPGPDGALPPETLIGNLSWDLKEMCPQATVLEVFRDHPGPLSPITTAATCPLSPETGAAETIVARSAPVQQGTLVLERAFTGQADDKRNVETSLRFLFREIPRQTEPAPSLP